MKDYISDLIFISLLRNANFDGRLSWVCLIQWLFIHIPNLRGLSFVSLSKDVFFLKILEEAFLEADTEGSFGEIFVNFFLFLTLIYIWYEVPVASDVPMVAKLFFFFYFFHHNTHFFWGEKFHLVFLSEEWSPFWIYTIDVSDNEVKLRLQILLSEISPKIYS